MVSAINSQTLQSLVKSLCPTRHYSIDESICLHFSTNLRLKLLRDTNDKEQAFSQQRLNCEYLIGKRFSNYWYVSLRNVITLGCFRWNSCKTTTVWWCIFWLCKEQKTWLWLGQKNQRITFDSKGFYCMDSMTCRAYYCDLRLFPPRLQQEDSLNSFTINLIVLTGPYSIMPIEIVTDCDASKKKYRTMFPYFHYWRLKFVRLLVDLHVTYCLNLTLEEAR